MAEIIKARKLNEKIIGKIIEKLRKGAVIIYPTETCYGLGCSIKAKKAIERIYKIKKRNKNKALSVIVSSEGIIGRYAKIGVKEKLLMKKFMPGPLTIVAEKKENVPEILSKEGIAFRIPGNKTALKLCRQLNEPIITTSANLEGEKEIYSAGEAIKKFSGKVDIIVDAGVIPKRKPSTIYDAKAGKVLREGKIKEKEIIKVLEKLK